MEEIETTLGLDFETEFLHDYIEIWDKFNTSDNVRLVWEFHCGWIPPPDFKSHENALKMYFVSDCFVHRKGFKIHYSAKGMY